VPVLLITGQSHSRFYETDPAKMFHGLNMVTIIVKDRSLSGIKGSHFEEALFLDRPSLIEVPMVDRQQELIDGIACSRSGLLRTR
jgi:hypothetical protein